MKKQKMPTMYDKLGDLLNQAIENGKIEEAQEKTYSDEKYAAKKSFEKPSNPSENKTDSKSDENSKKNYTENIKSEYRQKQKTGAEKKSSAFNSYYSEFSQKKNGVVYKVIPAEIEKAFKILGLKTDAGTEEIKKAYKEKLKTFHPDHYSHSEIMLKIATEKTSQLVDAYNKLMEYKNQK